MLRDSPLHAGAQDLNAGGRGLGFALGLGVQTILIALTSLAWVVIA